MAQIIKTHPSSPQLLHHPHQSRRALGFPIPRPASLERIKEAAILRYLVAGLVMILLGPGVATTADLPPADPVLIEATEFPGYAMFAESGAPGMVLVVVRGESSLVLGYVDELQAALHHDIVLMRKPLIRKRSTS